MTQLSCEEIKKQIRNVYMLDNDQRISSCLQQMQNIIGISGDDVKMCQAILTKGFDWAECVQFYFSSNQSPSPITQLTSIDNDTRTERGVKRKRCEISNSDDEIDTNQNILPVSKKRRYNAINNNKEEIPNKILQIVSKTSITVKNNNELTENRINTRQKIAKNYKTLDGENTCCSCFEKYDEICIRKVSNCCNRGFCGDCINNMVINGECDECNETITKDDILNNFKIDNNENIDTSNCEQKNQESDEDDQFMIDNEDEVDDDDDFEMSDKKNNKNRKKPEIKLKRKNQTNEKEEYEDEYYKNIDFESETQSDNEEDFADGSWSKRLLHSLKIKVLIEDNIEFMRCIRSMKTLHHKIRDGSIELIDDEEKELTIDNNSVSYKEKIMSILSEISETSENTQFSTVLSNQFLDYYNNIKNTQLYTSKISDDEYDEDMERKDVSSDEDMTDKDYNNNSRNNNNDLSLLCYNEFENKKRVYEIQIQIYIHKTAQDREIKVRKLMSEIGSDKIKFDIKQILCYPEEFRNKKHQYTVDSLLDFSCRFSTKEEELNDKLNENDFKLKLIKLHPYQTQTVHFMYNEETSKQGGYRKLFIKNKFNDGKIYYYSPSLEKFVFGKLPIVHGGLICEEMGLGKTIETIALINCHRRPTNQLNKIEKISVVLADHKNKGNNVSKEHNILHVKGTLIIAPMSLIGQWEDEIKKKSKAKLSVYNYYGSSRKRKSEDLAKYDVILTTYGILAKERGLDFPCYGRKNKTNIIHSQGLHLCHWWRVVLDESHSIKGDNTNQTKSILKLRSCNNWCLTGTPFSTKVSELQNQLKFVGFQDPMSKKSFWNEIQKNFESKQEAKSIPILHFMKSLVMRHKKKQTFNNKQIVKLPNKSEVIEWIELDQSQRNAYNKIFETAKNKFLFFKKENSVSRHYLALLQSLMDSRRACSGYTFNKTNIETNLKVSRDKLNQIVNTQNNNNKKITSPSKMQEATQIAFNNDNQECTICMDVMEAPTQTPCNHVFCHGCIQEWVQQNGHCPMCRKEFQIDQLKSAKLNNKKKNNNNKEDSVSVSPLPEIPLSEATKFDAKVKYLVKKLNELRQTRKGEKVLIFTMFKECAEWLCKKLKENNFSYRTITGSMTKNKRHQALTSFQNDPPTTVFVLTIRSGAVGITLTAANHVFLMEPPLNPALERQAVNRVYRLGQTKEVFITTLAIKNSIESKIISLNKDRRNETSRAGNLIMDKDKSFDLAKLFE